MTDGNNEKSLRAEIVLDKLTGSTVLTFNEPTPPLGPPVFNALTILLTRKAFSAIVLTSCISFLADTCGMLLTILLSTNICDNGLPTSKDAQLFLLQQAIRHSLTIRTTFIIATCCFNIICTELRLDTFVCATIALRKAESNKE